MVLYKSVQFQKEEIFLFSLRSVVIENYAKLELCEAMRKHSKAMSVHAVHEYVADPVTCSLMKSNSEFMAFHMKQVKYGMFVVQNLNYCY